MSKPEEGSVAPEERVNIVYRPAMAGAKEDVELPLKLLVTGEFTGAADPRPVEQRVSRLSVDKDNFNEVLKAHNCSMRLTVPNKHSGKAAGDLDVELSFSSMADFGPDQVAAQIPVLKALMDVRDSPDGS